MSAAERPLVAFRQEMPYRELWPLAQALGARGESIAFLDSGGDDVAGAARWSVLGWRPRRTLAWPVGRPGAIEALRHLLASRRMQPDGASMPYRGGFVGWIGYDIGRHVERLP